jgi:putative ABC transport system permease protein
MDFSLLIKEIGLAYFLVAAVVFYDFKNHLGIWKELVRTSLLALFQLFLIGFVILYLIKLDKVYFNIATVLVMTFNASLIASRRLKLKAYPTRWVLPASFIAIAVVNYFLLFLYTAFGVLGLKAHMLIPFAGLLVAAGMRSISLFSQYVSDFLHRERDVIEGMFALGASPLHVRGYILSKTIPLATVVIRDMFKAAGIVHIPGVMVGLLLAGTPPLKAAAMQFLVLASMLFSMFFTPILFYNLLLRFKGFYLEPSGG